MRRHCLLHTVKVPLVTPALVTLPLVTLPLVTLPLVTLPLATLPLVTLPLVTLPLVTLPCNSILQWYLNTWYEWILAWRGNKHNDNPSRVIPLVILTMINTTLHTSLALDYPEFMFIISRRDDGLTFYINWTQICWTIARGRHKKSLSLTY